MRASAASAAARASSAYTRANALIAPGRPSKVGSPSAAIRRRYASVSSREEKRRAASPAAASTTVRLVRSAMWRSQPHRSAGEDELLGDGDAGGPRLGDRRLGRQLHERALLRE